MLLAFCIPVFPGGVPAAILLLLVFSLSAFRKWKIRPQAVFTQIPLALFFLLYLAGMLITENTDLGWVSVERKLSFLIFPLLFLFIPPWNKTQVHSVLVFFVLGVLINSFISYSGAIHCFMESGSRDCMHSSALSYKLHPSYNAFYSLFSIALLLHALIFFRHDTKRIVVLLALLIWFVVFVVLLASKAGLIGLILVLLFYLIRFVVYSGKKIWLWIGAAGIGLVFVFISVFSPLTIERFYSAFGTSGMSEEELFEKYATTTESNAVRRMIWIVSAEIISEHPMGVGTGDVYPELEKKYRERKMSGALERELNTHSQYLQSTIALGYVGLFFLLLALLLPAVHSFRRNKLYVLFLMLTALNIAVESMFEVQAGIVFFAFVNGILAHYSEREPMHESNTTEL